MEKFFERKWQFLSIALVLLIGTPAIAECPDLSGAHAAQLLDNELQNELIADLVASWRSDEPVRLMKFGASVTKSGRLENVCCISSTHRMSNGARQRLGRKLVRLRFSPASNNGDMLRVHAVFTLLARKTPDGVQNVILQSHLLSIDEFGMNYIAPQRIWARSMTAGRRLSGPLYLEVQAMIDKMGHASDATVSDKGSNSAVLDGSVLARIESACYVPGFLNGEVTEMLYSEAFEQ